ncbi:MAG: HD domain-containing protein [Erysipelotrichaceae bacterium]|nr:HD domain-containing protein [Erysipelotrichaceae bacterium]
MKIKDIRENMGVEFMALVTLANQGVSNSNQPYLNLELKDNTGSIVAKMWNVTGEDVRTVKVGTFVKVKGTSLLYKDQLQLKVLEIVPVNTENLDMSQFITASPVPQDVLRETLSEAVESIENVNIRKIVEAIYRKYDRKIYSSPAATKNHHEYFGGLATHVSGMIKLGESVCQLYPRVNRDYLIAGILLHDIGKICELGGSNIAEYTTEGKLLGHISISQTMVRETARELGIDSEEVTVLRHIILAHHGKREFGSPVLPMTLEAEVLHMIDDLDAKINMIEKELRETKNGEFTKKIFSLDNRSFYKPKN